jgi:hypothetical protein
MVSKSDLDLQRRDRSGPPRNLAPSDFFHVPLGHGGYRVPSYEEQCQMAFAEQARIRAALAEAEKKGKLP